VHLLVTSFISNSDNKFLITKYVKTYFFINRSATSILLDTTRVPKESPSKGVGREGEGRE
jgi:hypothetical protein